MRARRSEGSRVLTNYAELIESYEVRSWAWSDLLQIEKEIRTKPQPEARGRARIIPNSRIWSSEAITP